MITRFAPSLTGYLHMGHVLHMLYVWGIARARGATVISRIEDHDLSRRRPEYEAAILENNIHQVYKEYGVTVIAIDMQEQVATVQNWADSQGVTYQILMSPNWDLFSLFPVAGGLPYNAVIGRDGVLRYAQILFNEEAITTTLNNLLGFDPVADEAQSFGQVKALYR